MEAQTFFFKDSLFFESCFTEILWNISMMYQTKVSCETKQVWVHSLNARNIFNKYYTDFETWKIFNI